MGQYAYVAADEGPGGLAKWDFGYEAGSGGPALVYDEVSFVAPVIRLPPITGDSSMYARFTDVPLTSTNFKIEARWAIALMSGARTGGLGFLTEDGSNTGYAVLMADDSPPKYRGAEVVGNAARNATSFFDAPQVTNMAELHWIRIELDMPTNTLRVRTWVGARDAQPSTWDFDGTVDNRFSAGGFAMVTRRVNDDEALMAISELYIGTEGDEPPDGSGPGPGPDPTPLKGMILPALMGGFAK